MIKNLLLIAAFAFALQPLAARAAGQPRIVFMIGEDEYHTWETLPEFAQKDLKPLGYRITIVSADPANKNNFPGIIPALRDADLLFLSTRRRTPPIAQLDAVRAYLASGRPLVGIRTACHAFALLRTKLTDPTLEVWQDFDPEVLGGHYRTHYKEHVKTTVTIAPGAATHPILRGVAVSSLGDGDDALYEVSPLKKDTTPLLIGTIPGHPSEPVAWTHRYGANQARIFFTSLGGPKDFQNADFRRLLVNGVAWALGK